MKDGFDHINVYSKGLTILGRSLSNFAHIPFEINGITFGSVEAWWYWRQCKEDSLKPLYGYRAKQLGSTACIGKHIADPTPEELMLVYQAKLNAYEPLNRCFKACKLPFDHYYVYNGIPTFPRHRWTGQLWNKLK